MEDVISKQNQMSRVFSSSIGGEESPDTENRVVSALQANLNNKPIVEIEEEKWFQEQSAISFSINNISMRNKSIENIRDLEEWGLEQFRLG
mmetsp:Transcript_9538/g.14594  ORF Transcript_9538/g.14594 Transcript_9538/m.14594 type:complete len:91 (+) Transcript_9538:1003-1275(+)|eukprot:CAMPEP_0170510524 /NCGR_PEP_ID=MMETSP0208-20121228/65812_1 /TAXON_ID=197538 /ORGANISM="Strombidium inclinatum, Strain S3" /LENGTH=90 /DNA_ID=CAMNT_0010793993 /DNA_START=1330 /DNA_END=1602 /DNA_ORIENTATION=+